VRIGAALALVGAVGCAAGASPALAGEMAAAANALTIKIPGAARWGRLSVLVFAESHLVGLGCWVGAVAAVVGLMRLLQL